MAAEKVLEAVGRHTKALSSQKAISDKNNDDNIKFDRHCSRSLAFSKRNLVSTLFCSVIRNSVI